VCECFLYHFEVRTVEAEKVSVLDYVVVFCFLFEFGVAFSNGS